MKLLRNPIAVGVLVMLAAVLVIRAVWSGVHRAAPPPKRGTVAPAAPAQASAALQPAVAPVAGTGSPAVVNLNQPLARVEAQPWSGPPRRDPFRSSNAASSSSEWLAASAVQRLALSSILRQTGGSVAVINRQVVGEGDTVAGFRVEQIEAEQVWVSGPNGREAVGFQPDRSRQTSGVAGDATGAKAAAVPP